jgi:hypothetical protein
MVKSRILKRHDVSDLVGLPVVVLDAAREFDETDGPATGVPRFEELAAAAAVTRCQMAPGLRGAELKTLRKILDMTQAALSAALGGGTAVVSISRWEGEEKGIGEAMEKVVRLLVCETLKSRAPGVPYDPLTIIGTKIGERRGKMAPMEFRRTRAKVGRSIEEMWTLASVAAAAKAAA